MHIEISFWSRLIISFSKCIYPNIIKIFLVKSIKYSKEIFKKSEIFLGVNNAFNQEYFDNIRINAFGKRYYEPAPKRNFYFGINLSF